MIATESIQKTTIGWWCATYLYHIIASEVRFMKLSKKLQKIRKENYNNYGGNF